jgi:hypothetical protein
MLKFTIFIPQAKLQNKAKTTHPAPQGTPDAAKVGEKQKVLRNNRRTLVW